MKKLHVIKFLSALLLTFLRAAPAVGAPPMADAQAEASVSEFTAADHHFSGLKLKGELKRPEFVYHPAEKGPRPEDLIVLPENFDRAIFQVTKER
jgi:hypothetical protein